VLSRRELIEIYANESMLLIVNLPRASSTNPADNIYGLDFFFSLSAVYLFPRTHTHTLDKFKPSTCVRYQPRGTRSFGGI
jgi:hypothetical protein